MSFEETLFWLLAILGGTAGVFALLGWAADRLGALFSEAE